MPSTGGVENAASNSFSPNAHYPAPSYPTAREAELDVVRGDGVRVYWVFAQRAGEKRRGWGIFGRSALNGWLSTIS
jgi:hypothetical protein